MFYLVLGTFELLFKVDRFDLGLFDAYYTAARNDKLDGIGIVCKRVALGACGTEQFVSRVERGFRFFELGVILALRFHLALGAVNVLLLEFFVECLEFIRFVALLDDKHKFFIVARRFHLCVDGIEFGLRRGNLVLYILDV